LDGTVLVSCLTGYLTCTNLAEVPVSLSNSVQNLLSHLNLPDIFY
jgi:hypothetical protein